MAQLTDTINEMIETLAVFADQVTNVAREVGVDGKLGETGQRTGCIGYMEKPYRKRKPAGTKPDHAGTSISGGSISGNQG